MHFTNKQETRRPVDEKDVSFRSLLAREDRIFSYEFVQDHLAQVEFKSKPLNGFRFEARLFQTVYASGAGSDAPYAGGTLAQAQQQNQVQHQQSFAQASQQHTSQISGQQLAQQASLQQQSSVQSQQAYHDAVFVKNSALVSLIFRQNNFLLFKQLDTNGSLDAYVHTSKQEGRVRGWRVFARLRSLQAEGSTFRNPFSTVSHRTVGAGRYFGATGVRFKVNFAQQYAQVLATTGIEQQAGTPAAGRGDGSAVSSALSTFKSAKKQTTRYTGFVGLSYNYRQRVLSLYKAALQWSSPEFQGTLIARSTHKAALWPNVYALSVCQRLDAKTHVAVRFQCCTANNAHGAQYSFVLGTHLKHWKRVDLRAKIDDRLLVSTSFKIDVSENAELILANEIDLGLRSSHQRVHFPLGFKLRLRE